MQRLGERMQRRLLTLAVAAALASVASAQSDPPPATEGVVPVSYVGSDTRISLGIEDNGDVLGEALHVFGNDGDSSWIVEGWFGQGGAGGAKLDYLWLLGGKTRADTIGAAVGVTVARVFGAIDQNVFEDRKATLGFGLQREAWFADAYLSSAISGRRLADTFVDSETTILTGTDAGRPFRQSQTVTTTTRIFEKPYDHGVGLRAGRFFDGELMRLRAGLDYERGDFDSDQYTLSFGIDKYLRNSGHSLTAELESYTRGGDFVLDQSDRRAWLLWRYELGQAYRPTEPYRLVETTIEPPTPPSPPPRVVRNEVTMGSTPQFALDRAELSDDAQAELTALIDTITSDRRVSRVRIVGHTCDLASDAYNQRLALRRAHAVRDYLIANGVPPDQLDVSGEGETSPRFPNDGEENRSRNRRVELSFLTLETHLVESDPPPRPQPVVEWRKEPIEAPAAWIERALRNPSEHKRTVDVYRIERVSSETTLGPREFINRPPVAQNDSFRFASCAVLAPLTVLTNDSDPDGDRLTVTQVDSPAGADARINADGTITLTPRPSTGQGFCGIGGLTEGGGSFNYSISDGRGGTATATVTVRIDRQITPPPPPQNRPPLAVDDTGFTTQANPVTIPVLANDSDPDNDPLRVVSLTSPIRGRAAINPDGTVTYTPDFTWCGSDTFLYTITDPGGLTASARVRVFRTSNEAPEQQAKNCPID
jgi:outer membrane protein OmpA-like peptidoglycan-associated protein